MHGRPGNTNPVALLRDVTDVGGDYQALMFWCPGCDSGKDNGLYMLAVNTTVHTPQWQWNRDLDRPTLEPSILTRGGDGLVCHSYLRGGIFQFLPDSTHSLSGQTVQMPPLPDWVAGQENAR